ncbi:class II aldolase/adducin family protein [Actinomyces sp.]|uniref:class II aldolase/adducin family protein n=1 Tax=Actinomyces sp. TaxID=29317 RepID=UPI0034C5D6AE
MLEPLKKDLCEIAKRAQDTGLCKHKSGNFSIRDTDSGLIVVSPTGLDRDLATPRDVVVHRARPGQRRRRPGHLDGRRFQGPGRLPGGLRGD